MVYEAAYVNYINELVFKVYTHYTPYQGKIRVQI